MPVFCPHSLKKLFLSKKPSTWQRTRKLFRDIHLWLGLSSGLIIIAVCLSGTIYVFNEELTEMAMPHLYNVNEVPNTKRIAPENFLKKIAGVSGGEVTTVAVYADPARTYQYNTKTKNDKSRSGTAYFVNPYTGDITGNSLEKNNTKEWMSTMFSLHRWLLLDKIEQPIFNGISNRELGSKITGWATILFTLGCITGLVIWFPNKIKNWRQGLKIKTKANWKRINHDLHNSLAFYALVFLLLMGITGPQWSFDWYRTGLRKSLGTYTAEKNSDKKKTADTATVAIKEGFTGTAPLSRIMEITNQSLPYNGDYRISLPGKGETIASVRKTKTGFFAPAAADKVSIDLENNQITELDIFSKKPFNERIAGSIKAIHVGNVYGNFTKILYFLACLIATSLPVTGTLIWLNKLKKRRIKKMARRAQQPLPQAETVVA